MLCLKSLVYNFTKGLEISFSCWCSNIILQIVAVSKNVIPSYGAVLSLTPIHSPSFLDILTTYNWHNVWIFEILKFQSGDVFLHFLAFLIFRFFLCQESLCGTRLAIFFKATVSGLDVSIMVPHWYLVGILTCSFLVTRGRTCLHHVSFLARSYFSSVSSSRHCRM